MLLCYTHVLYYAYTYIAYRNVIFYQKNILKYMSYTVSHCECSIYQCSRPCIMSYCVHLPMLKTLYHVLLYSSTNAQDLVSCPTVFIYQCSRPCIMSYCIHLPMLNTLYHVLLYSSTIAQDVVSWPTVFIRLHYRCCLIYTGCLSVKGFNLNYYCWCIDAYISSPLPISWISSAIRSRQIAAFR